ncbi:TetR/AcrR family transcriptional regulator C-terminal domain-containing protein [Streptomyces sp. WG5]|uniref:TetR/AcrR family transcriptional regulator C-terminal domain-containing protein n=1 Tax=Streptomyces sp. WG5 TaxID=3417648 RepID=UPI003CE6F0EC
MIPECRLHRQGDGDALEADLARLARQFLAALTRPQVLRLRRLVIADAFPGLGARWYEQGFERVRATLAATVQRLTGQGLLRCDEPLLAAGHVAGLLLWIPVNKAMFHGSLQHTEAGLDHCATAGVRVFLAAHR